MTPLHTARTRFYCVVYLLIAISLAVEIFVVDESLFTVLFGIVAAFFALLGTFGLLQPLVVPLARNAGDDWALGESWVARKFAPKALIAAIIAGLVGVALGSAVARTVCGAIAGLLIALAVTSTTVAARHAHGSASETTTPPS